MDGSPECAQKVREGGREGGMSEGISIEENEEEGWRRGGGWNVCSR